VLHGLAGEGQSDGVVAVRFDRVEDGVVVFGSESMGTLGRAFEAAPAHSGDARGLIVGVEKLVCQ